MLMYHAKRSTTTSTYMFPVPDFPGAPPRNGCCVNILDTGMGDISETFTTLDLVYELLPSPSLFFMTSRQVSNSCLPSWNVCTVAATYDSAVSSPVRIHDDRVTHLKPVTIWCLPLLYLASNTIGGRAVNVDVPNAQPPRAPTCSLYLTSREHHHAMVAV